LFVSENKPLEDSFPTPKIKEVKIVTVEIEENVDLHHREEMELVCPWCHTHSITAVVNHRTLRMKCIECGMDAFVTRIPRNKKLADYISRRLIA
jgi:hypothetical protein